MNGVSLNLEPAPNIALKADSNNLVKGLTANQTDSSLTQTKPVYTALQSRSQRCFSQFDRKTDCFDGGEVAVTDPDSRFVPNSFYPNNLSRVNGRAKALRSSAVWATFKAVCGTQTRHDGFVNKYQPCSQINQEVAELVDAAGSCRGVPGIPDERYFEVSPTIAGSNPAFLTNWQKSRRVRPLNDNSGPLREDDQEKALSTRTVRFRSGKSGSYCLRRIH